MKNHTLLPRWIAAVLSLIAIAGLFAPYIDFNDNYVEYLDSFGDELVFDYVDYTAKDLHFLSLFKYSVIYANGGEEIFHSNAMGIFYAVVFVFPGVCGVLTLLCALRNRPTLMAIFSLIMGGIHYAINWDVLDRGIMPSSNATWGVIHVFYYPCAVVLFICAVVLFVAKHKTKKERRRMTAEGYFV